MSQKKESCLGVFRLQTVSCIIAILQLFYNVFSIHNDIDMFESNASKSEQIHLPAHLDNAVPAIYHLWSVVADFMAIFASICLAIGNYL